MTKSTVFSRSLVSVNDDIPRSYLFAARPGMMLSKVTFETFGVRPITWRDRLREVGVHPDHGLAVLAR